MWLETRRTLCNRAWGVGGVRGAWKCSAGAAVRCKLILQGDYPEGSWGSSELRSPHMFGRRNLYTPERLADVLALIQVLADLPSISVL
jgi:hypothetical protein